MSCVNSILPKFMGCLQRYRPLEVTRPRNGGKLISNRHQINCSAPILNLGSEVCKLTGHYWKDHQQ
jgi:hypothetical protein